MSYLTSALDKFIEKTESIKTGSPLGIQARLADANDLLISLLKMITNRIDAGSERSDATEKRIDLAIFESNQSFDDLEALVCKLSDRIEVLESKDSQTTH